MRVSTVLCSSKVIRQALSMRGLLQRDVARRAELSERSITKAINGRPVSVVTARAIARVLRVPYGDLLAPEPTESAVVQERAAVAV